MSDDNPVFSMGTMQEEIDNAPKWIPLQENLYNLEVHEVKNEMRPSYADKSVEEEALIVTLKALSCVDGTPVLNVEGEHPDSDLVNVWLNPNFVGYNSKTNEPHKARKVLTAIMGVDEKASLALKSWDDLIGRKVRAYVSVSENKEGNKSNKVDKFAVPPKKEKVVKAPVKKAEPVAPASEVAADPATGEIAATPTPAPEEKKTQDK